MPLSRVTTAKGLSQEKLGKICNFHPTFISMIEKKQRNVTISTLEIVANALGVETYELLNKGELNPNKLLTQIPRLSH